ncbi:MAG TPA: hypothetical protein VGF84_20875 [Micromonosporaceae bacterium]|jgi:hypothetical protein
MLRLRLAAAAAGLALLATAAGVSAVSAPASAGVLGCTASAIVLEHDLRIDSGHAVGSDLVHITHLVGQLAVDVLTLNVTDIQGQAEYVVVHAADGTLHVTQQTVNDAQNTLTACQVH